MDSRRALPGVDGARRIATTLWLRSASPGWASRWCAVRSSLLVGGIAAATAVVLVSAPWSPAAARTAATPKPPAATASTPRLVSQLHADVVFLLSGSPSRCSSRCYAIDSPARVRRAARDLLVVQLAQGVVGYVQYFTDLPIRWCWCTCSAPC